MKRALLTALVASGLAVSPVGATGLLGGGGSVSVDLGLGGTSASASVGLGGSEGGVDASVEIGSSGGGAGAPTDPMGNPVDPHGNPIDPGDVFKIKKQWLVGHRVVASDKVVLGTIVDVRQSDRACPTLAIKPDPLLSVDHRRVWVQSNSCRLDNSAIHLSMASSAFLRQVRN